MAYLYRLIALLLLAWSSTAMAAFPATADPSVCTVAPCYVYKVPANTGPDRGGDPVGACQSYVASLVNPPYQFRYNGTDYPNCYYGYQTGAEPWTNGFAEMSRTSVAPSPPAYTCPANSTLSGTSCTCNAPGWVQDGGACVAFVDPAEAYCAEKIGSPVKTSWSSTAPSLSTRTVCSSGGYGYYSCNATIEPDYCGSADGVTYLCHGSGTSAGGACTPSPAPEQPVAPTEPVSDFPSAPPPGTCPGQINGVTVNMPCNNSVSKGTKTEASNDGAGNTTSKSESRSTTCTAAGACSTTVTTVTSVNGGASVTSTKTIEESKGDFCVGNPAAKECGDGDGSSFGGSCESGFVCEGDAVQCAHAKETHLQNCKLNKDTPERQLYEASKGDDADFDNDDVVNVGPSSFSQAPILGAASCISDRSITVMGSPVSLPFSRVCEYLAMLGNVLMAVGFLLSGRIIMRG